MNSDYLEKFHALVSVCTALHFFFSISLPANFTYLSRWKLNVSQSVLTYFFCRGTGEVLQTENVEVNHRPCTKFLLMLLVFFIDLCLFYYLYCFTFSTTR